MYVDWVEVFGMRAVDGSHDAMGVAVVVDQNMSCWKNSQFDCSSTASKVWDLERLLFMKHREGKLCMKVGLNGLGKTDKEIGTLNKSRKRLVVVFESVKASKLIRFLVKPCLRHI